MSGDGNGSSPLRLQLTADYLTCQIDCIPYRYMLNLDLPLGDRREADPELAARIAAWSERVPLARSKAGLQVTSHLDRGPGSTFELRVEGDGLTAQTPDLFFESDDALTLGRPTAEVGIDVFLLCDFLEGTATLRSDVLDRLAQAVNAKFHLEPTLPKPPDVSGSPNSSD